MRIEPMRSLALYTDRYLAKRFAGQAGEDELGHLLAASSRSPKPAGRQQINLCCWRLPTAILYGDGRDRGNRHDRKCG